MGLLIQTRQHLDLLPLTSNIDHLQFKYIYQRVEHQSNIIFACCVHNSVWTCLIVFIVPELDDQQQNISETYIGRARLAGSSRHKP